MSLPSEASSIAGRPFIRLGDVVAHSIMQTLKAGWELARESADMHAGRTEVEITEQVRDAMRCVLNSGKVPWGKSMIVLPGTESRSSEGMLVPDGRTDIPLVLIKVFIRYGDHDPHAIIECKRISGKHTQLCRRYVKEGIDRFKSRKYASNHSNGFMAGYLIEGDSIAAVARINSQLNKRSRRDEALTCSTLNSDRWLWRSQHPRTASAPITLHHGFFRF